MIETVRQWMVAGGREQVLEVLWGVGYDPGRIVAKPGVPLRIAFHRIGANPATEHVCFPDFGLLAGLTPDARTVVEIGPRKPGRYKFCAPDEPELVGWLVVQPAP